jgi:hypothetical protein
MFAPVFTVPARHFTLGVQGIVRCLFIKLPYSHSINILLFLIVTVLITGDPFSSPVNVQVVSA